MAVAGGRGRGKGTGSGYGGWTTAGVPLVSFEVPSRSDLLAAHTPEALFGAAVSDPRALRRAWAALAKAFRAEDDPEAFRHARDLYEQARAAGDRPEPVLGEVPVAPEGDTIPAPPRPPSQALAQAVAARDWQCVVDTLLSARELLLGSDPRLTGHAVERLITVVGPWLSHGVVDDLELLLSRPALVLPPDDLTRLEVDLVRLRHLRSFMADAAVPEPYRRGVQLLWYRRSDYVAEAWCELAERHDLAAMQAAFAHVEVHHPTVYGMVRQADLRMRGTAAEGGAVTLPADVVAAHAPAVRPSRVVAQEPTGLDRRRTLVDRVVWAHLAVTLLWGGYALLIDTGWLAVQLAAALSVWSMLLSVGSLLLPWKRWHRTVVHGRLQAQADLPLDGLLALARDHGLFPHEVAVQLAPPQPLPPVSEDDRTYVDSHPLLRLEQAAWATFAAFGPAHVARLRAVFTREEAADA